MPVLSDSCNVRMASVRRHATRDQNYGKLLSRKWLLECQCCDMSLLDLLKAARVSGKHNGIPQ